MATSLHFSSIVSSLKLSISLFCSFEANWYRAVGALVLTGMTTSDLYANDSGVAPVEVHAVVLYEHKTLGSSSAHLPLYFSSRFLSIFTIILFVDLAWPFFGGCLGVTKLILMLNLAQKSWNPKLMNCKLLFVTILFGTPNLQIIFF